MLPWRSTSVRRHSSIPLVKGARPALAFFDSICEPKTGNLIIKALGVAYRSSGVSPSPRHIPSAPQRRLGVDYESPPVPSASRLRRQAPHPDTSPRLLGVASTSLRYGTKHQSPTKTNTVPQQRGTVLAFTRYSGSVPYHNGKDHHPPLIFRHSSVPQLEWYGTERQKSPYSNSVPRLRGTVRLIEQYGGSVPYHDVGDRHAIKRNRAEARRQACRRAGGRGRSRCCSDRLRTAVPHHTAPRTAADRS